jgi:putative transposase
MIDIIAHLQCLAPYLTATTLHQLSRIIVAILAMTGRVTMLGISRWAGKGGSYRTIQRFFYTAIPWAILFWLFFRQHLFNAADEYLLAGDEVVVSKAGKHTYGLDRFFSSLYGKPVPGIAFFALSLISTQERRSFPTMVEQMVRSETEKTASKAKAQSKKQRKKRPKKRAPGRPKGSKNKDKTQVTLTPELQLIKTMVQKQLLLLNGLFSLTYLLLDGHFGNNNALQVARQCSLHLISKLRYDAALYFPYDGPYSGRGPRRKYGHKIDYANIPNKYLQQTSVEENIQTDIYQAQMLHKEFAQPLNVVIIVKINLKTQARAHVILFSSDLDLPYDKLVNYYGLRFQIEFNFRDAKQYWGLEDFMNIKETAVINAANLSLFMVNVAHHLLIDFRLHNPRCGVLDLKAHFRGHKYVIETLKLLPELPEPVLLAQIYDQVAALGSIHTTNPVLNPP